MKYSWFRIFISLLLIFVLVINISPIKAEATGLVEGLISAPLPVEAKVVAGAILVCLGIMAASDPTAFNNAVDNFVNFLSETTSYVVDGMINVFGVVGADGLIRSYLPQDLLETGLGWAFDPSNAVLVADLSYIGDLVTANTDSFYEMIDSLHEQGYSGYFAAVKANGTGVIFYDQHPACTPPSLSSNGVHVQGNCSYGHTCRLWPDYVSCSYVELSKYVKYGYFSCSEDGDYATLGDGLVLGQIQAPVDEVAFGELDAYSSYAGGAISIPGTGDDEELHAPLPHLPVRVPALEYNEEVTTQTQEEAQTGVTDLEFEFAGDDVVTDDAVTDTDVSGAQSVIDHFTPSGSITDYSLDLTALFPFCIPFDIYNFLSVLRADPVAPVFEFDLNLGVASAPICIDLSGWSDLASIVRALEVALFCVGLALKTKELIGT